MERRVTFHFHVLRAQDAAHTAPLKHDPEKWEPVFGKDHAQIMSQSETAIQPKTISL
jgi:hypothetical protein